MGIIAAGYIVDPTNSYLLERPTQSNLRGDEVNLKVFGPKETQDTNVGGKNVEALANSTHTNRCFFGDIACGGSFIKADIMGYDRTRTIWKVDRPPFKGVSFIRGGSKGGKKWVG